MIFVHARNDTARTARALVERAKFKGQEEEFRPNLEDHPRYTLQIKEVNKSRSPELKEFFTSGFGIHHAGAPHTPQPSNRAFQPSLPTEPSNRAFQPNLPTEPSNPTF